MKPKNSNLDAFSEKALSKKQSLLLFGGSLLAPDGNGNGTGTASNSGHSTGGEFGSSNLETPPTNSGSYSNEQPNLDPWIKYGSIYETP